MNLTTEPWIPIVWDDGKPGTVSLTEAFSRGDEIRDLAVRPHERIALMRLLICVAQAALDGPVDYDDWKTCYSQIVPAALDYLKCWRHAFELFGEGPRFLQVDKLKKKNDGDEGNAVSKLDLALATGNNPTLFDNAGGSRRNLSTAQLALNLLTFQCFSPGGRIGVALWNGKETAGKGSSDHAPCIAGSMVHALVRGERLLETIQLNLLSRSQVTQLYGEERWGCPVWEQVPNDAVNDDSVRSATATYLGRLVPFARAVRLDDGSDTMVLANGLTFAPYPEWREPTATVVVRQVKGQSERTLLRASLDRAPWRELHSLTIKTLSQTTTGGPIALQNLSEDQAFDLWVGGLVADQAKLVDTLESVFHVPAAMLTDPGQRTYEAGVRYAEDIEFRLRRAVSVYHNELGDSLDRSELGERRKQIWNKATAQFWTDIEQAVPQLLDVAAPQERLGLPADWTKTDWGKAVRAAMLAAYEYACPHNTPRQMRAYVLGLNTLGDRIMSNNQPDPKETAAKVLAYLRQLRSDRGAMADLRRALNPAQRHRAWPLLARFGGIGKARYETVAGLFAYHPEETSTGNLGTTCRQLGAEHNTFEGRFRRLLACDRDDICDHVRPVVFAAKPKGVPVNYERLFVDLWYWSDAVKERWATEFWGAPQPEETVAPAETEATP